MSLSALQVEKLAYAVAAECQDHWTDCPLDDVPLLMRKSNRGPNRNKVRIYLLLLFFLLFFFLLIFSVIDLSSSIAIVIYIPEVVLFISFFRY